MGYVCCFFFFFKQKTAYEMRISDWSSDVCSSDLGLVNADGGAKYPGGYADYMVNHERKPGIGMLAGWRGPDGTAIGTGAPNPDQLERYKANGRHWRHELAPEQRYNRHANRAYLDWAVQMGFIDKHDQIVMQLYREPLQRFRLADQGQDRKSTRL